MRRRLPLLPADRMVNEDILVLTCGARTLAEQVGHRVDTEGLFRVIDELANRHAWFL